jgi:hypothetical protein
VSLYNKRVLDQISNEYIEYRDCCEGSNRFDPSAPVSVIFVEYVVSIFLISPLGVLFLRASVKYDPVIPEKLSSIGIETSVN